MVCFFCPPSKDESFWLLLFHKVFFFLFFIVMWLDKPKNPWINISLKLIIAVVAFLPILIIVLIFEFYLLGVKNMKVFVFSLLALIVIGASFYVISEKATYFNPLTDLLLNVFLVVFSVIIGMMFNESKIRKEATNKWMPAAESACKELITISSTIKKLQKSQHGSCDQMEGLLDNISDQDFSILKMLLENKCRSCSNELSTVRNQLDKSVEDWEVFLGNNCDSGECDQIFSRIEGMKKRLLKDAGE